MNTPTNTTALSAPPAFGHGLRLAACASLALLITMFAASVINHSLVSSYAPQAAATAHSPATLPAVTVVASR